MLPVLVTLAALHFLSTDTTFPPVGKLELVSGLVTFRYQRDLARSVEKRGIDFVFDADFENTLKQSGAKAELILAARSAHSLNDVSENLSENQAIAYLSKCAELEHKGQTGGVAENCEPALELLPNNVFVLSAVSYALAHDFRSIEGLPLIQQAIRLAPESSEVHRVYANVFIHEDAKEIEESERKKEAEGSNEEAEQRYAEKFDFAVSEYLEAIRLDPDNTIAHYELGETYGSDQAEKAVVEFREVSRLDPTLAEAACLAGEMLEAKDKLDEALIEYAKAEKADPTYARAFQRRAAVLNEKELYADAIHDANQAIVLDPGFTPSRLTLSNAYFGKGEFEQGMKVLREAALADPDNPAPTEYMVGVLYHKGDLNGAGVYEEQGHQNGGGNGYPPESRAQGSCDDCQRQSDRLDLQPELAGPS